MDNPLFTHETRWFFSGRIPPDAQAWFTSLGKPEPQPPRTDRYLRGVSTSLGVKMREGRLEVKQRQVEYGFHPFSPAVSGRVESWTKWSFDTANGESAPPPDPANWLPVTKERQVLYFSQTGEGGIAPSTPEEIPEQGGGLEVTQVFTMDEPWWTIGVEVTGDPENQFDILANLLHYVFQQAPPPPMEAQFSYSYPHWLARVIP
ncbi:MAG: hypothetical protein PVI99_05670 [Anaerolineales bacterium]|jgi:hypothetical protein